MISFLRQRILSHPKLLLLLLYVLSLEFEQDADLHKRNFVRDLSSCPACFQHQAKECMPFFEQIQYKNELTWQNFVSLWLRSGKRDVQLLQLKHRSKTNIIAKNFAQNKELETLQFNIPGIAEAFFREARLDGLQYCPANSLQRFVEHIKVQHHNNLSELPIWLYMLTNVQALLLPYLHEQGYAVPGTYAVCGFAMYQEYAGTALRHYYKADFMLKLKIAHQLLQAVLKFSHGFAGFRLYITDLNADNLVYNRQLDKLYFVDLDTVLIVDSEALPAGPCHRHEYIECDDCFAYAPQDICAHQLSDVNLFAACQLLREDLKRQLSKGFLHPVPMEIAHAHPQLLELLDTCVDCVQPECVQRFAVVADLLAVFENILLSNEFRT